MKIAVVGATGLVGREMIRVLEDKKFPVSSFFAVASERSVGKKIAFSGKEYQVISLDDAVKARPDIALFSAGGACSKIWAPKFAEVGTVVIDNSSAWRMNKEVPLVVPEINGNHISRDHKIIANPNCSTIQMVMALAPLHRKYNIRRLVVSTYQSVSGSGAAGLRQLMDERKGVDGPKFYAHPIDLNVIPHAGDFDADGDTTEEIKLQQETNKILDADIATTATVVRVPVEGGHSEAVNIEFLNDFTLHEVQRLLGTMPGVVMMDFPQANIYPTPLFAHGRDEVFVGRIRRDRSQANSLNLWIVSDNLRKGAATNAVQIAVYLRDQKLV